MAEENKRNKQEEAAPILRPLLNRMYQTHFLQLVKWSEVKNINSWDTHKEEEEVNSASCVCHLKLWQFQELVVLAIFHKKRDISSYVTIFLLL